MTVTAESNTATGSSTATTSDNGQYRIIGLDSSVYIVKFTAPGYVGVETTADVSTFRENRPINVSLPVAATGGRFRSETTFASDPAGTMVKFDERGNFEFEDPDGEGDGTYGIQGTSAVMVVRNYDGPDDKFSITEPIKLDFASDQFTSGTMGDVMLTKQ